MFHFNVDLAIECLKSLIDNTQCVTCDKLIGPCVRFPCGHSVCEVCALGTGECLYCLASPASYVVDKPQTVRIKNTAALLTAFQETFKIDVLKRQRISDHLKAEKLVFPECIQAPQKYSNIRKSLNCSLRNKENLSPNIFPGEKTEVSNLVIMKKSSQYVQNWLNQHEKMPQNLPRRPFGDINVNTQSLVPKPKQDVLKLKNVNTQVNPNKSTYRKRSHLKLIHKTSSLLGNVVESNLEIKNPQKQLKVQDEKSFVDYQINHKCDKNESGIVLDDEPVVIDITDTNNIDKDKEAWLSVLKAAEKDETKEENHFQIETATSNNFDLDAMAGTMLVRNGNNSTNMDSRSPKKVLFYKKSSLFGTGNFFNNNFNTKTNSSSKVDKFNDVSIVINNSAFTTTIKFTHCDGNDKTITDKHSVAIQTDDELPLHKDEINNVDANRPQKRKSVIDYNNAQIKIVKPNEISPSLDIFATGKDMKQDSSDNSLKRRQCLIIDDSDTDSNISCDNTHEVVVDVHRSSEPESVECGILRQLSKTEYQHKTKRQTRSQTPNSSNSSDKENLDPNRKKVVRLGKKSKKKSKQ